jgi:hypothetical protein
LYFFFVPVRVTALGAEWFRIKWRTVPFQKILRRMFKHPVGICFAGGTHLGEPPMRGFAHSVQAKAMAGFQRYEAVMF